MSERRAIRYGMELARRGRSAWLAAALTFGGVNSWASLTHAQASSPSAEEVAAARQLAAQGVTLAHEGKCKEAIDPLSRAERLYHAPTILVELGYCQCEQGFLVEGTEALNRVARENLGSNPPPAFLDAQTRAKALLEKYTPKLAKLVITVEAPPGAQFEVAVDGKVVSSALLGVPRPTDPGEHKVTVQGNGFKPAESAVTLAEGGQGEVALRLEVAEAVGPVPPPDAPIDPLPPPVNDTTPPVHHAAPNRVPMYVSYGVGAAGLVLGTVFGLRAMNKQSRLDERCLDGQCPPGSEGDIDGMNTSATLATVGFAVGVLGAGLGTYFLLTEEQSAGAGGPTQVAACRRGPCVRAVVGLGALGMEGVF